MVTRASSRFFAILVIILGLWQTEVKAQSSPCTTPTRESGLCVAIQRCRNIYGIVSSTKPQSTGIMNYIKRSACTLPGIDRSVCCQLAEVAPEPPTTPKIVTGKENLLPKDCGLSINDRIAIAFGNGTKVFSYPWMALLRYKTFSDNIVDGCGGSLINSRYVLTAAHCIKTSSSLKLEEVRLGEHTRSNITDCNIYYDETGAIDEQDCAGPVQDIKVESYVVHADYNRPKFSNDIGLIRLASEVVMQDHIRPICLPVTPELRALTFKRYIVTGWGTTENNTGSDVLLYATVPFVTLEVCQEKMRENRINVPLSNKQMCAGGEGKVDTCRGDSGGPLGFSANYNGAKFVQFGIVSAGVNSCGLKSVPGIYCHVGSYMDWILDSLQP